jgi:hypothetical protein
MIAASKRDAPSRVALAAIVIATVTLAACTAGASVATSAPASAAPASAAPASAAPIETPAPSATAPSDSGVPGDDLGPGGSGAVVVPRPGQLDVHPIAADSFSARVDGRHVVLTITYTSGVEPCSILDTIIVQRGQGSFAITLREGHGPGNQVCIMIAKVMTTQVDLGDLDPGSYAITDATGRADPIQVIVS